MYPKGIRLWFQCDKCVISIQKEVKMGWVRV